MESNPSALSRALLMPRGERLGDSNQQADCRDRLPHGDQIFRGLQFDIVKGGLELTDNGQEIPVLSECNYVVFAHTAQALRREVELRPGQLSAVGEEVAQYELCWGAGRTHTTSVRLRVEISPVWCPWGELPFGCVSHRTSRTRSHDLHRLGQCGVERTGVIQGVYANPPDVNWWMFAVRNPMPDQALEAIRLQRVGDHRIWLGGISLFRGTEHPLKYVERGIYRVALERPTALRDVRVAIDLGEIGECSAVTSSASNDGNPLGDESPWLHERDMDIVDEIAIELAATSEAVVSVDGNHQPISGLISAASEGQMRCFRLKNNTTGELIPCRFRIVDLDGRVAVPELYPNKYRGGWGCDHDTLEFWNAGERWFYTWGKFDVKLLSGSYVIDIWPGPLEGLQQASVTVSDDESDVTIEIVSYDRAKAWQSADLHVHFMTVETARVQAACESVDLVYLLATQWGDYFSNVAELWSAGKGSHEDPQVLIGTENRQGMLGHLLCIDSATPVTPLATGGPMESRVSDPVDVSLTEWAEQSKASGGLIIGAHFPHPHAEVVALALLGLLDAVELRYLGSSWTSPDILAWYELLDAGINVPCVGGSDKMWAGTPIGASRTWFRTDNGQSPSEALRSAILSGKTVASSGPIIDFRVDGEFPKASYVIADPVQIRAEIDVHTSASNVRSELVVNGVPVATGDRHLVSELSIGESCWIAARASTSEAPQPAGWPFAVAAHSSASFFDDEGDRRRDPSVLLALSRLLEAVDWWITEFSVTASHEGRPRLAEGVHRARLLLDKWISERG